MRRLLLFIALLMVASIGWAQSAYISYSACDQDDRIGNLDGAGGILIISAHKDLVISVINDAGAKVSPPQQRQDGKFEYSVVVDRNVTKEPNIEVNRRGDVNRVGWVVITKPDYFRAYLIEEVQTPIRIENQTKGNDAGLDKTKAEVEFQSTINDLTVSCQELVARGATITKSKKRGDNSINIITVTIPISILDAARSKLEKVRQEHEVLRKKLLGEVEDKSATKEEWDCLEQVEEEEKQAAEDLQKLTQIRVFAQGTNQLPVDISGLRGQSKMVYGVLLLKVVEKVHVSKCAGFMEEGGRQFSLRQYKAARNAFTSALSASDTPKELESTIRTSIAQCDTCMAYEQYVLGAFSKIRALKNKPDVSQQELVDYASAAIEYLQVLNRYNEDEFYTSKISMLEDFIGDLPLEVRFTITRWVNNAAGFFEAGAIPNVEIWAFNGSTPPVQKSYADDKKFVTMVGKSNEFEQLAVSDAKGISDIQLNRKTMPTGLFFRPVGYDDKIKIQYMDLNNLLSGTQGTYNKRRFHLKMYASY